MGVRIFVPLPKPSPLVRVRVFGRVGWVLRSGHPRVTLATAYVHRKVVPKEACHEARRAHFLVPHYCLRRGDEDVPYSFGQKVGFS